MRRAVSLLLPCAAACAYNPDARPYIEGGRGWFAQGDVLLWKAQVDGLPFAVEGERVDNPHFEWDFGWRLGVGYRPTHDRWDLCLNWTHMHSDAHARVHGALAPVWPVDGGAASAASAHWRLHLGLVDLELSYPLFAGTHLIVVPHVGLQTAIARQKYNILYEEIGEDEVRMKNKFFGVGPRCGLKTLWEWAPGWFLYGSAALSLLYGNVYLHQDEDATVGVAERLKVFNRFHTTRSVAELGGGIRWERAFSQDRYLLAVHLGWDQILLFGQNALMRFVDPSFSGAFTSYQGDVSLQGASLGVRFDF